MKVKQGLWSVEKLLALKEKIDLNPAWQRGPAWRPPRRALLIDSILRGMDVPKIYLRKLPSGGIFSYEVVDGQQRLRAIFDFADGPVEGNRDKGFVLTHNPPLAPVHGIEIAGKRFGELSKTLKDRFNRFRLGVGEIVESNQEEITALFARLQMGMPLNPAELRNAELGPMRNLIQLMATTHEFFAGTKMRDDRNKYFEFASNAFAIAATFGERDMKAANLRDLQREYNQMPTKVLTDLSARVGAALNVLAEVDQKTKFPITRKWIFVDLLLLVLQMQAAGKAIDIDRFTEAYDRFEARRRSYTSRPEALLRRRKDSRPHDAALYDYIYAFRAEGATSANLLQRNKAIAKFFRKVEPN